MGGPFQNREKNVGKDTGSGPVNTARTNTLPVPSSQNSSPKISDAVPPAIFVNLKPELTKSTPYFVHPSPGVVASNNTSSFPVIVENGMNMTAENILAMGQGIADKYGRPALVVPNHTEGVRKDIRNCILSAFSDRHGIHAEKDASSHLASIFVSRLGDKKSIEINGYSQGTLICQDVLSELRSFLIESKQKDLWDSFAERVDLRTYGAAMHRWPEGIKVREQRHIGDPVAVIGDFVSTYQHSIDILKGNFKSGDTTKTILPVFENAHSIQAYLDNNAKFIMLEIKSFSPQEKANYLISSMNRSEYSNREYDSIINILTESALSDKSRIRDANNSILAARELALKLVKNPDSIAILSQESIEKIVGASSKKIREEPKMPPYSKHR